MTINNHRSTVSPTAGTDRFDRVWAKTSDADKQVLLGHTNPALTPADKIRLAKQARDLGAALRAGKPTSFHPAIGTGARRR